MWMIAVAAAAPLQLTGEVRWADDAEISLGEGARGALAEGYVFGVRERDGGPDVGFVFVGEGEATFALHHRTEAAAFANTLAARGKVDAERARTALDDRAWTEPFDTALVVGDHPALRAVWPQLPVVTEAKDGVVYLDTDPAEVVVDTWRLGPARRRAEIALANRTQRLAGIGLDPVQLLAIAPLAPDAKRWLAEVRTDRSWRPFLAPSSASAQEGWLSFAHDPTGLVDDTYRDNRLRPRPARSGRAGPGRAGSGCSRARPTRARRRAHASPRRW